MNETFNINTATKKELMSAVHIGPKRADLIIEKRNQSKFKDLYELSSINGFGRSRIDDIIKEGILVCN